MIQELSNPPWNLVLAVGCVWTGRLFINIHPAGDYDLRHKTHSIFFMNCLTKMSVVMNRKIGPRDNVKKKLWSVKKVIVSENKVHFLPASFFLLPPMVAVYNFVWWTLVGFTLLNLHIYDFVSLDLIMLQKKFYRFPILMLLTIRSIKIDFMSQVVIPSWMYINK